MSIINLLKSVTVISFGACLGYFGMKYAHQEPPKNRFIASQGMAKIGKEQIARSTFAVRLDLEGLAQSDSDVSTLKVEVIAVKPITTGLFFQWNVPTDVQIIEGALSDAVGEIAERDHKFFTLKVKNFSKQQKKFISFEINGDVASLPMHREVLISSKVEDSFEYVVQQNERQNKKSGINKLSDKKAKSRFAEENVVH